MMHYERIMISAHCMMNASQGSRFRCACCIMNSSRGLHAALGMHHDKCALHEECIARLARPIECICEGENALNRKN